MRVILQRGEVRTSPESHFRLQWMVRRADGYMENIWKTHIKTFFVDRRVKEDFIRGTRLLMEEFNLYKNTLYLFITFYNKGFSAGRVILKFDIDEDLPDDKEVYYKDILLFRGKAKIYLKEGKNRRNEIVIKYMKKKKGKLLLEEYDE